MAKYICGICKHCCHYEKLQKLRFRYCSALNKVLNTNKVRVSPTDYEHYEDDFLLVRSW